MTLSTFKKLVKEFSCDICDKVLHSKQALAKHKLIHANTKPFKCDECDYQGRVKSDLRVHKKSHDPFCDTFNCEQCDYKAKHKVNLKFTPIQALVFIRPREPEKLQSLIV